MTEKVERKPRRKLTLADRAEEMRKKIEARDRVTNAMRGKLASMLKEELAAAEAALAAARNAAGISDSKAGE